MIRRFGETVRSDQTYRPRPGVYAILLRGSDILMTYQEDPRPEPRLPGGGTDPGESPLPALHREVWEETGWTMSQPRRLGAYRRFTYMPEYDKWAEKICTIYLARPVLRLGPPTEAGHSPVWVPLADAAGMADVEGERQFLASVARRLG